MKRIEKLMMKSEKVIMKTIMPEVSFGDLMGMDPDDYVKMQAWWEIYKDMKDYAIEQEKEMDDVHYNVEKLIKLAEAQANEINELKNMVRELAKTNELIEE